MYPTRPPLPPPPPPPPPPPTTSSPIIRVAPPVYTAPVNPQPAPAHSQAVPGNLQPAYAPYMPPQAPQPPPPLPIFDASRPPPPLHMAVAHQPNIRRKRRADHFEAGPSKARKPDSCTDGPCEKCVQLEIRIKILQDKFEEMERTRECKSYLLENSSEEYENLKLLLQSAVVPELFRFIEAYVEGSSQTNDMLSQLSPFFMETSTVPQQFLMELMQLVFTKNLNRVESSTSSSVGENNSLLQTLSALSRRSNLLNFTSQTDVLQALLQTVRNSSPSSSSEIQSSDPLQVASTSRCTAPVNGYRQRTDVGSLVQPGPSRSVATGSPTVAPRAYAAPPPPQAVPAAAPAPPVTVPTQNMPAYSYQPRMPNVMPYYNNMSYGGPMGGSRMEQPFNGSASVLRPDMTYGPRDEAKYRAAPYGAPPPPGPPADMPYGAAHARGAPYPPYQRFPPYQHFPPYQ